MTILYGEFNEGGDIKMNYNGPIVRPQTEADAIFIEVTVGCTHNSCTFCNFYEGYPFRVAPLSQVEADLEEASKYNKDAWKVWASGGNPFALSVEKLATLAKLFKKYLPKARIATYARVDDLYRKSVEDIKYLKDLGYDDIVLGIESGDDEVLEHVNKGYTSEDILRECKKLEEAGMEYRVIYLGGLAGHGKCEESALRTAKVLNQLHPNYMFLTTATIIKGTKLYDEVQNGTFVEVDEIERVREFRTLCQNLKNEISIYSATSTTMFPFIAHFPEDKEHIVSELDNIIRNFTASDETLLRERRSKQRRV